MIEDAGEVVELDHALRDGRVDAGSADELVDQLAEPKGVEEQGFYGRGLEQWLVKDDAQCIHDIKCSRIIRLRSRR